MKLSPFVLLSCVLFVSASPAAPVLVNEYNAVRDDRWLDEDPPDPTTASDSFFGRVESNGGDWFELVVVGDGTPGSTVDMREWTIEIIDNAGATTLVLSGDNYWSDVQAGTILTFIENDTAGGGRDSGILVEDHFDSAGWAWTNIHIADPTYIGTASSDADIHVSHDDTDITLKNASGTTIFGPAGEGISSAGGVNSREIFQLRTNPSATLAGNTTVDGTPVYSDGIDSTFGAPNEWSDNSQSFLAFRVAGPAPGFTSPASNVRLLAGEAFAFTATATDGNDGDLTITAPTLPAWLTLTDNRDGTADLTGTPATADAGLHDVILEVADDPSDGSDSLSFTIEVFPSPVPILLNEYNGDNAWLELAVVADGNPGATIDMRGWTIRMEDDNGTGDIRLSDSSFWEDVPAGTILLFAADNAADGGFDTNPSAADNYETSGWGASHFFLGDTVYLDEDETTDALFVSNEDAKVTVLNGDGDIVFGPAGEGVESDGGVNGSERFALDADPSPSVSPIGGNYIDSDSSTPGEPNDLSGGGKQNFEAFATGPNPNSPPFFTNEPTDLLDYTITVGTEYFWIVETNDPNFSDSLALSLLQGPSWLELDDYGDGTADLFGTPQAADAGSYTVEIEVSDGSLSTTQSFEIVAFPDAGPVIVNEFNAVANDALLDDGEKTDPFWGAVEGNGGDWFELVVIGDGSAGSTVDLRGWTIEISDNGGEPESIVLSQNTYWSNVRAGTILTFTEDGFDAGGLDTGIHRVNRFDDDSSDGGWAWSNILVTDSDYVDQAASDFGSGFAISSSDTRILLRDAGGIIRFGPSGEEFLASGGVGPTEVYKLEANPSATFNSPLNATYADGSSSSFGAPNLWSGGLEQQDFSGFHTADPTNSAPFFTFVSPRYARQSDSFSGAVTADDFDGTSGLTLTLDSAPAWLSLADNGNGNGTLSGTPPTSASVGLQSITVSVSDGTDSASKSFPLYVHPATATVLLNEYNAVASDRFLNGGDVSTDEDGGAASDSVFGRVEGNGGDWFELVVVGDGSPGTLDMRGWSIEIADNAAFPFAAGDTIVLSQDSRWAAVPAGTLLTFTEKRASEGGRDTDWEALDNLATEGWAWSNVWIGDGSLIDYTDAETNGYEFDSVTGEVSGIGISQDDTQFVLRDADGDLVFGPVGEGVAPESGVGSTEIFELEADPSPTVSPLLASTDGPPALDGYEDGSSGSTFGRPNDRMGGTETQDFSAFIPVGGGTSDLEDYLTGFGLSGADLLPDADSDNDGTTQIEEFAFGSNPTLGGSLPDFRESIQEDGAADHLTLTFLRRTGGSGTGAAYSADGITYEVEGSLDLLGWNEPVETTSNPAGLPAPPAKYEWATCRLIQPIEGNGATDRGFLRVSVTETAEP